MGAGKTAVLAVRIISDAKDANKGFDEAEAKTGRWKSALDKASVAATAAVGGILAIGKAAFDSASELQQASGAVEAVFGAQSAAIDKAAKSAANSVGLAQSEYSNLAAILGSQLKNMGFSGQQLAPQVEQLIGLGADLSATYGGTAADAVEALSALLRGETDPIERYGVSIKQSDINARLAADGQDKLTGAAAKAAQAHAVLALLTQQTTSATGAFAREADTAAGQQQRATAEWENAKAALGESLLPLVTQLAEKLAAVSSWAKDNTGTVQALAIVVGGLAAAVLAVNAAVTTYEAIAKLATAAQWLWNVAMDANPIGLVVTALAAIVAGVILAYNKFQWFRDFVQGVGLFVAAAFDGLKAVLGWIVDKVKWFIDHVTVFGWVSKLTGHGSLFDAPRQAYAATTAQAYAAAADGPTLRASALGSTSSPVGPTSFGSGLPVGGDTINVTITGAVDPVATGDQLRRVLDRRDKQLGRVPVLRAGLAR